LNVELFITVLGLEHGESSIYYKMMIVSN